MDMPLIFGNCLRSVISNGVTQKDRVATRRLSWFKPVGVPDRQIRQAAIPEKRNDLRKGNKALDSTLPRKTSSESSGYPYRKPTQVDEEKILRRSREHSLRNSA
jgi:hypothetical protein